MNNPFNKLPTTSSSWNIFPSGQSHAIITNVSNMLTKQLDGLPKATIFGILIVLFSMDYIIGASFRPWWDILLFIVGMTTVMTYFMAMGVKDIAGSNEFYVGFTIALLKLVYLLNYILREAHVPSFLIGMAFSLPMTVVPAAIEKFYLGKNIYTTGYGLVDLLTKEGSGGLGDVMGNLGQILKGFTQENNERSRSHHHVNPKDATINDATNILEESDNEYQPDDLDDAVNAAVGKITLEDEAD